MVNIDSTGFGGAEFAQVVPGVQVGKRLTLENLNERLTGLEAVVQQLVEATYTTTENELDAAERAVYNGITGRVTRESQEKEIGRLKAKIEDLRCELSEVSEERDAYKREIDELEMAYDQIESELSDVRSTLRTLT